jgi:hypothetical protein
MARVSSGRMTWLHVQRLPPSPVSKPCQRHTGRLRKRDKLLAGRSGMEGDGLVAESYDSRKAWSSINHSMLSESLLKPLAKLSPLSPSVVTHFLIIKKHRHSLQYRNLANKKQTVNIISRMHSWKSRTLSPSSAIFRPINEENTRFPSGNVRVKYRPPFPNIFKVTGSPDEYISDVLLHYMRKVSAYFLENTCLFQNFFQKPHQNFCSGFPMLPLVNFLQCTYLNRLSET